MMSLNDILDELKEEPLSDSVSNKDVNDDENIDTLVAKK